AGSAPHYLGVGLEEHVEQTGAEPVADPVLEAAVRFDWLCLRTKVAGHHRGERERTEIGEHVGRLQRVVEEPAAVIDSREPRTLEQIVAEELVPQLAHARDLRKEAVTADVEAEAFVDDGLRKAADLRVAIEDDR